MAATLLTLGQSLDHWQALYIVSISIALISTFSIVFFAFHKDHPFALRASNYVYVVASLLAVLSTIVIVNKTKSLDAEKDRLVKIASEANDLRVAQANRDAAAANQKAQEAQDQALEAENDNLKLRGQTSADAAAARQAEAELAKSNKETSDFAHALAQQQGAMAEQAKVSPVLSQYQIGALANLLAPYAGQDVILHSTADTTVLRLKETVALALQKADVTFKQNSMDMGALYQGVSVAVNSAQNVPLLANALVLGLRQAGIDVHPVTAPQIPAGRVALFMGPN
jgi:hypothetical protein